MENKYNFGDLLRDKVTGLEGIVQAYTFYATGCLHYGLQPVGLIKHESGKLEEHPWFWHDESRLELISHKEIDLVSETTAGGPSVNAPQIG